jgi:hypothetical protein
VEIALASNERARLNHPTAMKRRYEAARREEPSAKKGKSETRAMKLERELDRLTDERDSWRKRAEAEGSLFDLKKDSIKDIAGHRGQYLVSPSDFAAKGDRRGDRAAQSCPKARRLSPRGAGIR